LTGNPIRTELLKPEYSGAHEFLKLEKDIPVILVIGGSQGALNINEVMIKTVPRLIDKYQIIHQTGEEHYESIVQIMNSELANNPNRDRYKIFPFLNNLAMRMSAGVSDLIISRAGSSIFEIALWGIPSIIIPIPQTISRDQRTNAFSYAETGAAVVIEEANLDDDILISQISNIMESKDKIDNMKKSAIAFARKDASEKIAKKVLAIALEHQK